jgi:hypothetical protein
LLLLLLSLLASKKEKVVHAGLIFVSAKFIAYLAIGLSVYWAASGISLTWLSNVSYILAIFFLLACAIVAALNIIDCVNLLRKKNARIYMQLPIAFRRFNRKLLENLFAANKATFLLPIIFVAGLIISAGEFLCTGQIYLASILYTLQRGVESQTVTIIVFLTYIIAMCIPSIILIILVGKGRSILALSNILQERLWLIKLLNGLLFTLIAVLIIIFYLV